VPIKRARRQLCFSRAGAKNGALDKGGAVDETEEELQPEVEAEEEKVESEVEEDGRRVTIEGVLLHHRDGGSNERQDATTAIASRAV
jgi:hypothetical protein